MFWVNHIAGSSESYDLRPIERRMNKLIPEWH